MISIAKHETCQTRKKKLVLLKCEEVESTLENNYNLELQRFFTVSLYTLEYKLKDLCMYIIKKISSYFCQDNIKKSEDNENCFDYSESQQKVHRHLFAVGWENTSDFMLWAMTEVTFCCCFAALLVSWGAELALSEPLSDEWSFLE